MIFILTELYYPEETSTGFYLTKIAEALAEKEETTVITALATSAFIPVPNYPNYEVKNKVNIWRCGGTKFAKDWFLGRVINGLSRSFLILLKGLRLCQKNDVIMVVTNPPLLPFIGLLLKRLKGVKLVVLIHDLYPDVLVATGVFKTDVFFVKLAHLLNHFLYQNADRIITLGRDMSQRIYSYLQEGNKNKIKMIPHWSELELISPQSKFENVLLKELNLIDKFIILYSGNMGRTHNLEMIIDAAKQLKVNPIYHFIIAGMGYKKQWVSQEINYHNLTNITLLDPVSRKDLNTLLNACDVGIIALISGMIGVSVPSRTYNHLASGKPIIIIAESESEVAQLITENQVGWVIQPNNTRKLLKIIELAHQQPDLCASMGKNGANLAKNAYSFSQILEAYQSLFNEIIS